MFKFTVNIGTIVSRPIIFRQLWPYYENIVKKLHSELDLAKVPIVKIMLLYK